MEHEKAILWVKIYNANMFKYKGENIKIKRINFYTIMRATNQNKRAEEINKYNH